GEFLVGLKRLLKRGEWFKLRTPAAMASVRGTLFWGKSDKDRNLTIAGFGHRVDILALGKNVSVDAGMTTTVTYGKPPEV
ncbi:hypothetical protein NL313_27505, partial [Klebsiella pneumoniae]|nr:hypothetical protein [Klebsiella pneumoniae]